MRSFTKVLITLLFIVTTLVSMPSCKKQPKRSLYDLSIVYSDGKIDGKLAYKFVNTYDTTFSHVVFNLHANAYQEGAKHFPTTQNNLVRAYPNGVNYGEISITNVNISSSPAKYQIYGDDGEFLKVFLDDVKKNEDVIIEIDFLTKIPESALRLGKNSKGVNLADFFPVACKVQNGEFTEISYSPIGDPYFADLHDYEVDITVPSEYTVASSGFATQTTVDGTNTTYSYELHDGRDFAFLLSKDYRVACKTQNDIVFSYYGFSGEEEEFLDLAIDCANYFSNTFGNIQNKSITVAECQFALGGMEYSGLCYINCDLEKEEKKKVIVHEIAHQWWHSAVGNDQNLCAYIDEGLAEYSTYLYLKQIDEKLANDMINSAKCAYKSFFSIEETLQGKANSVMQRELSSFKNEYEYANVAYNKSLLAFYEYGKAIGEDKAIKNLSRLYENNFLGDLTLEELIETLGYGEHFNSYVFGNVLI